MPRTSDVMFAQHSTTKEVLNGSRFRGITFFFFASRAASYVAHTNHELGFPAFGSILVRIRHNLVLNRATKW